MTSLDTNEEARDPFKIDQLINVKTLFEARCHFGHVEGLLNGHMRPYIFGKRLGVLIIDLEQTAALMRQALQVAAEIAFRKGVILFVMENRQNAHLVEETAKECGEFAYCRRWNDEVFTNSQKKFGSVTRLPDLCIFLSTRGAFGQHRAVLMSAKMMIPTIGICDTNSDPTLVTWAVPGNDDTPDSIALYCQMFKQAILNGKERRQTTETQGQE